MKVIPSHQSYTITSKLNNHTVSQCAVEVFTFTVITTQQDGIMFGKSCIGIGNVLCFFLEGGVKGGGGILMCPSQFGLSLSNS